MTTGSPTLQVLLNTSRCSIPIPRRDLHFSGAIARIATSGKTWHHNASERQLARLRVEPTCLFYGNFIGPPSSTIIRRTSFREFSENLVWVVDIAQYIQILQETGFCRYPGTADH